MALVEVAFLSPRSGGIDSGEASNVDIITSSGANQVTAGVAKSGEAGVVTVADGNVFVAFGKTPDALTDPKRRLVIAGSTRAFDLPAGHKIAVTDA